MRTRSDSGEGKNDYGQMKGDIPTNQSERADMPSNFGPKRTFLEENISFKLLLKGDASRCDLSL